MTFNTKLNIGDPVWHISPDGSIRQTTVTGVSIDYKRTEYYQGEYQLVVVYESGDNRNFNEDNEGKTWWASRRGIIDYLTKTLHSVGNGKKSNPITAPRGLNEEFEEFFRDELPKPPREHFKIVPPPMKSDNKELQKVFEDVFGPPPPAKKERCDCGVHRISELRRRFNKRIMTREKTLDELFDELFNE